MMDRDELLTVNEAAAYLRLSPWTLRHWVCDKKIPFVKLNGVLVRFRMSDLQRFVNGSCVKAKVDSGKN